MKKSKLDAVLRRKVRIKITRRKRGHFRVIVPIELAGSFNPTDCALDTEYGLHVISKTFTRKTEALIWLYTKLRCMTPKTIEIRVLT